MSKSSEPTEKWQRVLDAAKANQKTPPAPDREAEDTQPPAEFSSNLIGRLRAFNASLAAWQRWSLLAGLISILIFIASLIYLKSTSAEPTQPLIDTPRIDVPKPTTPTNR